MSMAQQVLKAPVAWSSSVQYRMQAIQTAAGIGGGYVAVPVVIYNNTPYYALVSSPSMGVAPSTIPLQWGTLDSNNATSIASVTTTLQAAQTINVTSTAATLDLSSSAVFSHVIVGSDITINSDQDAYSMAGGKSYILSLTAQGDTFVTIGDELQVYFEYSINAGSIWTGITANAKVSSIGVAASGVKGSAHSVSTSIDFTGQAATTACLVRVRAVVVQSTKTCNISSANQFSVIVSES